MHITNIPPLPLAVMNIEKLQKMAGTVRTGGKGTVRRYALSILSDKIEVATWQYITHYPSSTRVWRTLPHI